MNLDGEIRVSVLCIVAEEELVTFGYLVGRGILELSIRLCFYFLVIILLLVFF